MANRITYILGAGASFESIPIVKNFNRRLLFFEKFLLNLNENATENERSYLNMSISQLKKLYKEFSSHQSFDTYFKKHFHLGNDDEINIGKRILNLYFLWEHSTISTEYIYNSSTEEGDFVKESLLDKRYDALVAGLLSPKKGKSIPFLDINFISWNYDLNLIASLKNFFYPSLCFEDFFKETKNSEYSYKIGEKIEVVNINGSFYSDAMNSYKSFFEANFREKILEKITTSHMVSNTICEDSDKLKFSWELDEKIQSQMLDKINSIISESDTIVVIGYTFPLYNRLIDNRYLGGGNLSGKEIYIQDPDSLSLIQNFKSIFSINTNSNNSTTFGFSALNPVVNCTSFFVPSRAIPLKV